MSETQGGGGEGLPPGPPPETHPYGRFPAAPPWASTTSRVERPAPVRKAAFAWWGAVACWFLGSVLSQALDGNLIRFTSYRSERAGDGTVLTTTTDAPLPVGVAVFTFLLLGGLWALLVFGMYRGASWARALLAVFAVLGTFVVVGQLIGLAAQDEMNGGDLAHLVFFLATLVLTIAGWVLMYRDGAKPYFVKRR